MNKAGAALAAVVVGLALGAAVPGAAFASIDPNAVRIKNGLSGLYLEPNGDSHTAGTLVAQRAKADNSYQGWERSILSGGNEGLINLGGGTDTTGLGINGASRTSGAQSIMAKFTGAANQQWIETSVSGGVRLKNANSGLCLGITNASVAPGAVAAQFTCSAAQNQVWVITKAG
jgi:hypothetical protein